MKTWNEIPNLNDRINRQQDVGKSVYFNRNIYIDNAQTGVLLSKSSKVRIVTKVVIFSQTDTSTIASPSNSASIGFTNQFFTQLNLKDSTGTIVSGLSFLSPNRNLGLNEAAVSPALALVGPKDSSLVWEPLRPLVIPENFTLEATSTSGTNVSVWMQGYEMDAMDARALGYDCTADAGASPANRRWILASQGVASGANASPNTNTATVVAARAKQHIRIDDIVVRINPSVVASAGEYLELQEWDGTTATPIFRWVATAKNGDCLDKIIKGPIYTNGKNVSLRVVGTGNLLTTTTSKTRVSIVVSGQYVDSKPDNFWYSCQQPPIFGPSLPTHGAAGQGLATTIKAPPGKGFQYIIDGVDFSGGSNEFGSAFYGPICQLVGGTSPTFVADSNLRGTSPTNTILIPPYLFGYPCQQINYNLDRLAMPVQENCGIYFEDAFVVGTPVNNTISKWSVTVWGTTENSSTTSSVSDRYK